MHHGFSVRLNKSLCSHAQSCTADCRLSHILINWKVGRAVAQAISPYLPTAAGSGHVEFVEDKAALGQLFSGYLSFPAKHSSDCSTLITNHHYQGLVQ
jgi:hypothetical protein